MDSLHTLDLTVFRDINHGWHSHYLTPIAEALSYSGLGLSITIAILCFAIWRSTRPYVVPMLIEHFVSGVPIAEGLKSVLPRDRPSQMFDTLRAEPHLFSSFPSGHSTVSFGAAFMFIFLTWGTPLSRWSWLGLVWALMVGLSRMYRGVHWPTDVFAGFCAGLFGASLVFVGYQKVLQQMAKRRAAQTQMAEIS